MKGNQSGASQRTTMASSRRRITSTLISEKPSGSSSALSAAGEAPIRVGAERTRAIKNEPSERTEQEREASIEVGGGCKIYRWRTVKASGVVSG